MPIGSEFLPFNLNAHFGLKVFLILFLIFYVVFAVLLLRQVVSMAEKVSTPLSPVLRFVGIIHVGLALAITFLIIGSF